MSTATTAARHAYTVVVPVRTQTESNTFGFPMARAKRAKDQRLATWAAMNQNQGQLMELRSWPTWKILLKRVAPGTLDREDNLPSALKHIRDEVAKCLRVGKVGKDGKFRERDDDHRLSFSYDQRKGPRGHYAVEVRFEMGT